MWRLQWQVRGALGFAGKHSLVCLALLIKFAFSSAATPPNDEADDDEDKNEAPGENVRPATKDHFLILFLLLLF